MPDRKWNAHFGICKDACLVVIDFLDKRGQGFEVKHVLWALYFLKVYTTENVAASFWRVDEKTLRMWIWRVIDVLNESFRAVSHSTLQLIIQQARHIHTNINAVPVGKGVGDRT
jgi:hypothetical protein